MIKFCKNNKMKTRSIQKTQIPPRLWPLSCDRDLLTRSRTLLLSYIMFPYRQMWCSFLFVNSCLYPSGDNLVLVSEDFFFPIGSTCFKAVLKLLLISWVDLIIYLALLARLVSALTQAAVSSLVFRTCEYEPSQIFFFFFFFFFFFYSKKHFFLFFIDDFGVSLFCNIVIFGIKMTVIKFPIEW